MAIAREFLVEDLKNDHKQKDKKRVEIYVDLDLITEAIIGEEQAK